MKNQTPTFITKDSGVRQNFESGMRRDTQQGKPDFALLLTDQPYDQQMLTRWASLMERGAAKYGRRNWQLANSEEELERFKSSAFRHFMQWVSGETDEDHAAAVFFNITAAEYVKSKVELKNELAVAQKAVLTLPLAPASVDFPCEDPDCKSIYCRKPE